jgi:hypothetical protein
LDFVLLQLLDTHNILPNNIIVERSLALGTKRDNSILESVESMILTDANIGAWETGRATLAQYDLTYGNMLTVV